MKALGWRQWTMLVIFALVVTATGLFAVRTVRRAVYWRHHRDEPIRPWMTIPYIAHSYRVPPRVLYEAIGIPPQLRDRRPLKQIALERNVSVDQIADTLQRAILNFQQTNMPPEPGGPDRGRSP
jgi:hypothetical protein